MLLNTAVVLAISTVLIPGMRSQSPPQDATEVRALAARWTGALIDADDRTAARLLCPSGTLSIEHDAPAKGCAPIRQRLRAYMQPEAWRESNQVSLSQPRFSNLQFVTPQSAVFTAFLPLQLQSISYSVALGSCIASKLTLTKIDGLWRIDSAVINGPTLCAPDL